MIPYRNLFTFRKTETEQIKSYRLNEKKRLTGLAANVTRAKFLEVRTHAKMGINTCQNQTLIWTIQYVTWHCHDFYFMYSPLPPTRHCKLFLYYLDFSKLFSKIIASFCATISVYGISELFSNKWILWMQRILFGKNQKYTNKWKKKQNIIYLKRKSKGENVEGSQQIQLYLGNQILIDMEYL